MELDIDSEVYSKDVVLAASYSLLDRAHVIVKRDKKTKNFRVSLIPREECEDLELRFHDLLLTYATYYRKAEENADLKKMFIATSLYALEDE